MAVGPEYKYDANILSPGVDLTLTGVGTPNLTATYGDYGGAGESGNKKATCTISIDYTDVNYVINNDNSITVTGTISGCYLARTFVASSTNTQEVTVWINDRQVFHDYIGTSQAGTWNLIPNAADRSFSVTIAPSNNPQFQWPASIHYKNHNTRSSLPADEFNLGLGIKNPNPPDYRPGAILDGNGVWQSHNRSAGDAHILTTGGTWQQLRSDNGLAAMGNPPAIRYQDAWHNQRKIGKE
jgi:hypothetical protein